MFQEPTLSVKVVALLYGEEIVAGSIWIVADGAMQSTDKSPLSRSTSVSLRRQAPPENMMSISGPAE